LPSTPARNRRGQPAALSDRTELRPGAYEQTAHITGDEEYRAAIPFPVTIVQSRRGWLISLRRPDTPQPDEGRNGSPDYGSCLPNPRDDRSFGCIRTL
jgi:hypothetical protein